MKKVLAFYGRVSYNKQCQGNKTADGVWRSLVARSAGGREVAGSNPVTPIYDIEKVRILRFWPFLFYRKYCVTLKYESYDSYRAKSVLL